MARLYSNENFPLPAVEALRRLGHVVITTQDAGRAGQAVPDHEVIAFARADRMAVLTLNRRHFIRLHERDADHAGIIVCTFDSDFEALAARVHALVLANEPLAGTLVRVNRPPR